MLLKNKKFLITGLANKYSIAAGIAAAMYREGAQLAFTYQNERLLKNLEPLAKEYGSEILIECDVSSDESITNSFNAQELVEQFDSINIKLMKCEGIANATHFIEEAQKYKLKTMLGCMIETSLGISEALMISEQCDYIDLDGALLIKNDPYRDLIQYNGPRLSLKKEALKKASI